VNSHGGQPQIVDIVAQRLRAEFQILVGRINTFLLGVPEGLFSEDELSFGWHGGEVETSMMLSIAPELVDMSSAKKFSSLAAHLAKHNKSLRAEGGAAFAWQAQDLNAEGVTGNAAAADAERGAAALDHIATQLGRALDELAGFDWSQLRDGPQ
jgi:creatinine amidohydrolase